MIQDLDKIQPKRNLTTFLHKNYSTLEILCFQQVYFQYFLKEEYLKIGPANAWKLWPKLFNEVVLQPYLKVITQLASNPETEFAQFYELIVPMREDYRKMAFRDLPVGFLCDYLGGYFLTNVYLQQ